MDNIEALFTDTTIVFMTPSEIYGLDEGPCPGIALMAEEEYEAMLDADEMLVPSEEITFVLIYPLNGYHEFTHRREGGWTRRAVFDAIRESYHAVYADEAKYGPFWHDIHDLFVEELVLLKDGRWFVMMGS